MPSHLLLPALVVVITAISVSVDGVNYYYYYQNPQTSSYACTSYSATAKISCHINTCYTPSTWNECCLQFFTYYNQAYKQCLCNVGTRCANSPEAVTTAAAITATTTAAATTALSATTTAPTTVATTTTAPTTVATTTTLVTTPTTTAPFVSICDAKFKALKINPSSSKCETPGMVRINKALTSELFCDAVIVPRPGDKTQKVDTTASCRTDIVKDLLADVVTSDGRASSIDNTKFVSDDKEAAPGIYTTGNNTFYMKPQGCDNYACPMDDTMDIDLYNCKIASWKEDGPSTAPTTSTVPFEAKLTYAPRKCGADNVPANGFCFTIDAGSNLRCAGQRGGVVYCPLRSTKEWILMGLAKKSDTCDKVPEIFVNLIQK